MNFEDPRTLERASTAELLRAMRELPNGPQRDAVETEIQQRDRQMPYHRAKASQDTSTEQFAF